MNINRTTTGKIVMALAGGMAAAPASAADMLSVGVGGYVEQWVGYTDRGTDISEVHFRWSLESDMGLKFAVDVQFEADRGGSEVTQNNESFARVSSDRFMRWASEANGGLSEPEPDPTFVTAAFAYGATESPGQGSHSSASPCLVCPSPLPPPCPQPPPCCPCLLIGCLPLETDVDMPRAATPFSASYMLAPGVLWERSIFELGDDNSMVLGDGTRSWDSKHLGSWPE